MAAVRTEILQLRFTNEDGKAVLFRIPEPREDLTPEEILEVMQKVIDFNIFSSSGGELVSPESARIVETITEEFDIDVN